MPLEWRELASTAVRQWCHQELSRRLGEEHASTANMADYYAQWVCDVTPSNWDSAIINWYDEDAALGWHRDLAERDRTLPIVTISLGDACSWAIRADESSPVSRCRLESGDVTVLAGPSRGYLHTVERIIAAPLLSPLKARGRLSITLRCAG